MDDTEITAYRAKCLHEFDPAANTWEEKTAPPIDNQFDYPAVGGNVVGYMSGHTKDFYGYDPIADTWSAKQNSSNSANNGAMTK